MTESEPEDARPWPRSVGNGNHPFGDPVPGLRICAYCAAGNVNAAAPMSVREIDTPHRRTEIFPGQHLPLLAAGTHPERFHVVDASGVILDPLAITAISGTDVCGWHLHELLPKLRTR